MTSSVAHARDPYASNALQAPRAERALLAPAQLHPRRLHSTDLLDGQREIEIEHAGSVYRLRRTSLGKLILTK